ncbi:MAG: PIN domain-containing protein [Chloroflexi bacterium]|nr:PIN domain-containing protein [Chloroflexota bacterium]
MQHSRPLFFAKKRICLRALTLWANAPASVDFVDALSVAQMEQQKISTIASFDEDFDRFPRSAVRRLLSPKT